MQPITAWAGLIAEAQATPRFAQPRRQLRQNLGTVLENPELADLAAAATLRTRHSDRRLVHIQPDISDSIHQARLPCMRLCAGHPAQPSTFCMPRGGPPITQRTSGLGPGFVHWVRVPPTCLWLLLVAARGLAWHWRPLLLLPK